MKVGISGSRVGLSDYQRGVLEDLLSTKYVSEFHHGDCVGVDAEAHALAVGHGIPVTIHPPEDARHRAFCETALILPVLSYRQRNRAIVESADELWAFPEGPEDAFPRSGTWMTVRMARKSGIHVIVTW